MTKKIIRDLCESFKNNEQAERVRIDADDCSVFADVQYGEDNIRIRAGAMPPTYIRMQTLITKKASSIEVDWPENSILRKFLRSVLSELGFKM